MARINAILDEEVDYGFEGGPRYKTSVIDLENGFDERQSDWLYPRHEYSATFSALKDEAKPAIIETFHACRGRLHSFKFKDWNDFEVTDQPLQVLPGTSNTIQLYKKYEFGEAYVVRPIQAIKTFEIRNAANALVEGVIDLETGEFTPSFEWTSEEYTLTCEFYVWVRFDDDYNTMSVNSWDNSSTKVHLLEDKFPFYATNLPTGWME